MEADNPTSIESGNRRKSPAEVQAMMREKGLFVVRVGP
jgi:hypothetical protein